MLILTLQVAYKVTQSLSKVPGTVVPLFVATLNRGHPL